MKHWLRLLQEIWGGGGASPCGGSVSPWYDPPSQNVNRSIILLKYRYKTTHGFHQNLNCIPHETNFLIARPSLINWLSTSVVGQMTRVTSICVVPQRVVHYYLRHLWLSHLKGKETKCSLYFISRRTLNGGSVRQSFFFWCRFNQPQNNQVPEKIASFNNNIFGLRSVLDPVPVVPNSKWIFLWRGA